MPLRGLGLGGVGWIGTGMVRRWWEHVRGQVGNCGRAWQRLAVPRGLWLRLRLRAAGGSDGAAGAFLGAAGASMGAAGSERGLLLQVAPTGRAAGASMGAAGFEGSAGAGGSGAPGGSFASWWCILGNWLGRWCFGSGADGSFGGPFGGTGGPAELGADFAVVAT